MTTPEYTAPPDDDVLVADMPKTQQTRRKRIPLTRHGFRVGSDSAIIVNILVQGGLDRQDINDKVANAIDLRTRNGKTKNIPSLISGLLARLEERGYYIESSWRVVPPPKKKRRAPGSGEPE